MGVSIYPNKELTRPKVEEGDLRERLSKLTVKDLYNLSRYEALPRYIYGMDMFLRNIEYPEAAEEEKWSKKIDSIQDRMNENNLEIATNAYRGSMNRNKDAQIRCLIECLTKGPLYVSWRKNITKEFKAFFNDVPPISFGDTMAPNLSVLIDKKTKSAPLSWNEFVDLFSVYIRISHNQEKIASNNQGGHRRQFDERMHHRHGRSPEPECSCSRSMPQLHYKTYLNVVLDVLVKLMA